LPKFERNLALGDYQITLKIETESVSNCNIAQQIEYITIKDRPQLVVRDVPVLVPGVPFQFSGAELSTSITDVKSAYWNFGDGTTKQGLFVTHTYAKPGTYSIEFIADDGSGGAGAVTRIEKEVLVNASPKASFTGPDRALPEDVLTFDASESFDQDGSITQFNWFFSDGTRLQGPVVSHTFKRNGNFTVTLSVADDANAPNSLSSVSKTVRVANAPDLSLSIPDIVCPGTELNLIRALSVPTNDTTRVQIFIGNKKISYKEAQALSFTFPGVYNLRIVLASLGSDGTSVLRHTLVVNGAPEIYAQVPELITIGAANEFATFDASNSFDPNGDLVRITWDFGDGVTAYGKKVQHLYKRAGTYQVKLSIIDDKNLTCSSTEKVFTVKVVKE
jgi:PKD repeat protein